jgi:hypothetical protein
MAIPGQMKAAYAEIDKRHALRIARQQANATPQPGTTNAYPNKVVVRDPRLA